MIVPVREIFRAMQSEGQSFSMARRLCFIGDATLNGKSVDFFSEVEINEGDVFQVGKSQKWEFRDGSWQKSS